MIIKEFPKHLGDYCFDSQQMRGRRKYYHYTCKCGHQDYVRTDNISEHNVCNHPEKYINKVFGRLKILSVEGRVNNKTIVKCECQCKNHTVKNYMLASMLRGSTTSCGCFRSEMLTKNNTYEFDGDICICTTTNGEKVLFDKCDYEILSRFCWCIDTRGYAVAWDKTEKKYVKMHNLIYRNIDGLFIDHINGNTIDNRRRNIRYATPQQNAMNQGTSKNNTSGKTGVHWHSNMNKWIVNIGYNNKLIHLGYFDDYDEAVKERERAEIKYFKEYRRMEVDESID